MIRWLNEISARATQDGVWITFNRNRRFKRRTGRIEPDTKDQRLRKMLAPLPRPRRSLGLIASKEKATIAALYGFRFAAIPIRQIIAVVHNCNPRDLDLKKIEQAAVGLTGEVTYDGQRFRAPLIEEFVRIGLREPSVESPQSAGLSQFREEIFHHRHLRPTGTWIFLNGLTLYYRLCSAWLSLRFLKSPHDLEEDDAVLRVVSFMLNVYLTRCCIQDQLLPIMEAFAHLDDERDELVENYGDRRIGDALHDLHVIRSACVTEALPSDSLNAIARWVVDIPFASLTEPVLAFPRFRLLLERHPDYNPGLRLRALASALGGANDLSRPPSHIWERPGDDALADEPSGLIWLMAQHWVPSEILWSTGRSLLLGSYRSTLLQFLSSFAKGGTEIQQHSYEDMPGVWTYASRGEAIIFDPEMSFFGGKNYLVAMQGFEKGFRGFTNLNVDFIRLQALFLNSIAAKIFGYDPEPLRQFVFEWRIELTGEEDRVRAFIADSDVLAGSIADSMEAGWLSDILVPRESTKLYLRTLRRLWMELQTGVDSTPDKILLFAGALYAHGF